MHYEAQDTQLQRWERLIKAVRQYEANLPGIKPFRDALERAYTQAIFNRRRKDVARAAAKEATRQLQASLAEAYDAESAVRSFLKSLLGFRSTALFRFGIKPLGKRNREKLIGFKQPG
jgi:hypothetical protein